MENAQIFCQSVPQNRLLLVSFCFTGRIFPGVGECTFQARREKAHLPPSSPSLQIVQLDWFSLSYLVLACLPLFPKRRIFLVISYYWVIHRSIILGGGSEIQAFVVTLNENHWIILLFNIVKIFHKFKTFKLNWIQKFTCNIDLRKQDFFDV